MRCKKSEERTQNDWINPPPWGIVREFPPARGTRRCGAMALSMDEQRMLAEIERRLVAEDPRLAARLSSFRRPSPLITLRTPRGRIIGSLITVGLVTVISVLDYVMVPFRAHTPKSTTSPQTSTSAVTAGPARIGPAVNSPKASTPASATA